MLALHDTLPIVTDNFCQYRNERQDGIVPGNRFRTLLGEHDWQRLPAATRARFGRKVKGGQAITYLGEVTHYEANLAGRILAQLARVIGGPLPIHADLGTAAAVTVTEDEAEGGQIWTRQYGRHRGFPQVIHSVKRFAGTTGLEEYLGLGFGIALKLRVANPEKPLPFWSCEPAGKRVGAGTHGRAPPLGIEAARNPGPNPAPGGEGLQGGATLLFESDHYFWRLGQRRIPLPRWLSPGALAIGHIDHGDGWFTFTLDLKHRLFGRMMRQVCRFAEARIGTVQ